MPNNQLCICRNTLNAFVILPNHIVSLWFLQTFYVFDPLMFWLFSVYLLLMITFGEFCNPYPWTKWLPFCRWHFQSFVNKKFCISIHISLKSVPKGLIDNEFRLWLGAEQVTSHDLKQCWPSSLTYICSTRGRWVDKDFKFFYKISISKFSLMHDESAFLRVDHGFASNDMCIHHQTAMS